MGGVVARLVEGQAILTKGREREGGREETPVHVVFRVWDNVVHESGVAKIDR